MKGNQETCTNTVNETSKTDDLSCTSREFSVKDN